MLASIWDIIFGPRPPLWNLPALLLWSLFGNYEDGAYGIYAAEARGPHDWRTAARWWVRNPFHNAFFHTLAVPLWWSVCLIGTPDERNYWPARKAGPDGVAIEGTGLIVALNVSMYYDVLPTQWQYRKRIGPYTYWGAWSAPTSAASVTLSGCAVNDTQVQYRWLRADGEPGVISEESTVTGGASPPITTGPAISYVNSGIATLATSVQNRSITLWPTPGSADDTKMHLIGTFLRQTVGAQRTVGADPLTFVNQSDAVSASLTNLATGVNTSSGANRRLARLSANTPTSAEKGVRASFSNGSGSYTSQMAAAAVKIDGAYSVITTAEAYAGGNMGTAAALSATIYLPAAGRLVVFAYTTDSAAVSVTGTGPSTVNFTEVGNIADGSVGRIVTLISNTDMAQGSYTINGSTLQGLQVVAVANPS